MTFNLKLTCIFCITATVLVYILGLPIPVMEVDAAQYASISREMLETGNFLEVTNRYEDYLDKPPLVFWLASLSYAIFGVSEVAYKLPSFLFALLAIYSTFRLAGLYYNQRTAWLSSLVLATTQALFLINNDVRTDTVLLGATIFACWHLGAYLKYKRWQNFFGAFLGIGLAMLAKGPLGLMVPVLAFGSDLIAKKDWKSIFNPWWLLGIVIVGIILLPMSIGLYNQWGSEGLIFYYWEQSFGRLTGNNEFVQNLPEDYPLNPLFFTHNFMWSFLPWSLIFLPALYQEVKAVIKRKFNTGYNQEIICIAGFLLVFVAMSFSRFKLPHYIFPVYPFAAIITAKYLDKSFIRLQNKFKLKVFNGVQILVVSVYWLLAFLLLYFSFPEGNTLFLVLYVLFLVGIIYLLIRKFSPKVIIAVTALTAIGVNFFLNAHVYPSLLKYQTASEAGMRVHNHNVPEGKFFYYNTGAAQALDFYARRIVSKLPGTHILEKEENIWVYTNKEGLEKLKNKTNESFEIIYKGERFYVTKLKWKFLNPYSRNKTTQTHYLLKFD